MDAINKGKFAVGTKFIGNVNGKKMEVVGLEQEVLMMENNSIRKLNKMAIIKDLETEEKFVVGLGMLEKCDVTIQENKF